MAEQTAQPEKAPSVDLSKKTKQELINLIGEISLQISALTESVLEKDELIHQQEKTINSLTSRGLKVKEQNLALQEQSKAFELYPEILKEREIMKLQLDSAAQFIASGAFPNVSPEQAFVLMKAGKEMGMTDLQALSGLYCVKGNIGFYGKALPARVTALGYKIKFTEEDAKGVTVQLYNDKEAFDESYRVERSSPMLKNSQAMRIAPRNKMRYHGIRQICNFHLAHHFGPVTIWEEDDFQAAEKRKGLPDSDEANDSKEKIRVAKAIREATEISALEIMRDVATDHDMLDKLESKIESLKTVEDAIIEE